MDKEADVVVIGGGITGTAVLAALSCYDLRCVLVEREPDIAAGTTKANSGILHAGFDAPTGSLKAQMNVRGNQLYHELQRELALPIRWTGSLVAAMEEAEVPVLQQLQQRGQANGVPGLELWDRDRVLQQEPNLNPAVKAALWAPTAGVCWPFGLVAAFAEQAVQNGASIQRECRVTGIRTEAGQVTAVATTQGLIHTRWVVNAAGVYADQVSAMAGDTSFTIRPRKGEYVLFDQTAQPAMVQGIVFPTPGRVSKGILAAVTLHGNVFVGPNAQETDDREDTSVTAAGLAEVLSGARRLLPRLPESAAITEYAGLRAVADTGDFVLGPSPTVRGLVQAAGIQSPGLTAAPAIGRYIADRIAGQTGAARREDYHPNRSAAPVFRELDAAGKAALIARDARYGRVICRCETITEGEIVAAVHRPCGARTVDGVKRRTRAGMGRCQGGFCGPKVVQILARELAVPVAAVRKETSDSYLYYDKAAASRRQV